MILTPWSEATPEQRKVMSAWMDEQEDDLEGTANRLQKM